jgi:hypothetical protein
MRTEKQRAASRRNGAKSRGPATPEGKRRSSPNAWIDDLTARTIAASPLHRRILVEQFAASYRQLRRADLEEEELFAKALASQDRQLPYSQRCLGAFRELTGHHRFHDIERRQITFESRLRRAFYALLEVSHTPLRNEPNPTLSPDSSTPSEPSRPPSTD